MVLNGVHALLEPATLWTEPAAQKPTDNPVDDKIVLGLSIGFEEDGDIEIAKN